MSAGDLASTRSTAGAGAAGASAAGEAAASDAWFAVDTPVDIGLAGLRAHLERLRVRHDLRSLTVVVDDPDVGRQAFRVGTGALSPGVLGAGPGVHADPPVAADALDAPMLVALCAACLRVDVLRGATESTGELALRRLPGVYAVEIEHDDDLLVCRLHVDVDAPDDVGRRAARTFGDDEARRVVVEIVRAGVDRPAAAPAPAPSAPGPSAPGSMATPSEQSAASARGDAPGPAGPELLAVRSVPEEHEIEAHVAFAGSRAVGRAPLNRGLVGAVESVLAALAQLAPGWQWQPAWARTVETTADGRFVVALALVDPNARAHRHGIAGGSSPIEAAARATTEALT